MRNVLKVLIALTSVSLVQAQNIGIANVTSTAPFTLRGASVTPSQGVPSWPVMAGDVVKAGSAPTTFTFPDGSVITLEPGSEARIEMMGNTPTFRLLSGSAQYSLKTPMAVRLFALNRAFTPNNAAGVYSLGAGRAAAAGATTGGIWTAGHTALALGIGAGLGGVGYGIGQAVNGGAPASPSH